MRRADNRRGTYSRACASLALETAERWIDWVVDDVNSVAEEDFFMGPDPFTKERPLFLNAAAVDLRQYGPKCPPLGVRPRPTPLQKKPRGRGKVAQ